MLKLFLFIAGIFFSGTTPAQSVSGSWYGKADVMVSGSTSNYLTEFVLKQKGDEVEGIFGYYFKDSYQSFFVRGSYDKTTRQVSIKNLPMLFYASPTKTGIECPMHFLGTLMVSKLSSTLKGNFYTDSKYRYTCPELRVNMIMDANEKNQDSMLLHSTSGKKFWKPQEEDFIVSGNAVKKDTTGAFVTVSTPPFKDTVPSSLMVVSAANNAPAISEHESKSLVDAFGSRNNIYEKDLVVLDDSIRVSFYDNGDVDDDTISLFLNKKPILVKRGLTSRALNIYIGLDSTIEINELSLFADNLGKFPPNTALMIIYDGTNRYELYLSASLKQNASVRLRRPRK